MRLHSSSVKADANEYGRLQRFKNWPFKSPTICDQTELQSSGVSMDKNLCGQSVIERFTATCECDRFDAALCKFINEREDSRVWKCDPILLPESVKTAPRTFVAAGICQVNLNTDRIHR